MTDPAWLTRAYEVDLEEKATRGDLTEMYKWVFSGLVLEQIDAVLRVVDVTRLAPIFLVGLSRVTYAGSYRFTEWGPLVSRCRAEFLRRDPQWDGEEMRGLVDAEGNPTPAEDPDARVIVLDTSSSVGDTEGPTRPWWLMLLDAPDRTLDASMFPLIQKWSDPPRAIEILEVVDKCIYGSLAANWVVYMLQTRLDSALETEGIPYDSMLPLATWRADLT